MMLAHSKADLHEETLGYWRQLVCLDGVGQVMIDPPTCTSALKSAVACNEWDEAETIADMLKVGGKGKSAIGSAPVPILVRATRPSEAPLLFKTCLSPQLVMC